MGVRDRIRERDERQHLTRLEDALRGKLEPGEEIRDWAWGRVHRRGHWLLHLLADKVLPFIDVVIMVPYHVVATDRRILTLPSRRLLPKRPRAIKWAEPFAGISVEHLHLRRFSLIKLALRHETEDTVLRLEIPRVYHDSVIRIAQALGHDTAEMPAEEISPEVDMAQDDGGVGVTAD
jgi:hypothetical protein